MPVLTLRSSFELPRLHFGEVGDSVRDQFPIRIMSFDSFLDFRFGAIHLNRLQKNPVRKMRNIFLAPTHSDKSLDIIIPRSNIRISNRPIDPVPVYRIGSKFQITPPVGSSSPDE